MSAAAEQKQLLERALALAKKIAPDANAELSADWVRQANTRFGRSEITSTGDVEELRFTIKLAYGKRRASTETNQVGTEALRTAIESAARLARISPEDPEAMPPLGPQTYSAAAPAFDQAASALDAAARAKQIAAAIAAGDEAKVELAGLFQHSTRRTLLSNSAGLLAEHESTLVHCSVTARHPSGTGSGWAAADSHLASEVDAGALAKVAAGKAARSANPRALEPGRYSVILEPHATLDLLGFFVRALDARQADEGRSYFAKAGGGTKAGEKLFSEKVTLRSDPRDPALPTAPFDSEGMPLQPFTWVDKGTLRDLVRTRYWAAKKGGKATGRPNALKLEPGSSSVGELIGGTKRGVLITRFWYIRMLEPRQLVLTGLTRDGVFLVEDGHIVAPVNNFRFNESPAALLQNVDSIGSTLARSAGNNFFGAMAAPALAAHDFNLASVSAAV